MLVEGQARSIGELVDEVRRIAKVFKPDAEAREEIWFRGQHSCDWGLSPNLYRAEAQQFHYDEPTLIDRFVALATPLVQRTPATEWEWYFLARHHGVPSRLLDWSESLFIALYFALDEHLPQNRLELDRILGGSDLDSSFDKCPTIWILDAGSLNLVSIEHDAIVVPGGPRSAPYLPYMVRANQSSANAKPIAVLPVRSNPRIVAQHGMFTLHGHEQPSIDALALAHGEVKLGRVRLDNVGVARMAADLRTCGVHRLTAFPDLDSVADHICWILQSSV